ncbi:Holliday junction ATP-dependent DNA helicase RuvA [Iodidimonas gelatinilytica]|uniref:Holliday junction branch migration complex subunit RuvA n=1 Tax=Iodidimonas gelatinilytica TaxID=1236966 RepID=A0A5A7N1X5_9PROT|nr:Holliday junction branch migration protein RuvA [Iodidimonas gelatinilytica]GEQ99121.1 Holliday junction ATP-dependent DNA helicase RuvA [Iodidimonas gelatinilytica]GER02007.1 Holliday junction ATP-dependent DNA helicase RuvA [Iodidimonas gelatinilytica]
MIAKLKGLLDSSGTDWLIIDVSGVGYLVFASGRTLGNLPANGGAISLIIETHVREDHIHLYGFPTVAERDMFRLLTSVSGVGAKVGLAILSVLAPDALAQAIAAGDKGAVARAQGVGPRLAQRIVTELKDKVAGFAVSASAAPASPSAPSKAAGAKAAPDDSDARSELLNDAVSALVNLGYGRTEAFSAISTVARQQDDAPSLQILIRAGLRELGR